MVTADDPRYRIDDANQFISPALVVFRDVLVDNIDQMIRISGHASRLRPHCKTHKMTAVTQIELRKGICKHKCATFAEAEMLAEAGIRDILLAYNLVGPNIRRAVEFVSRYVDTTLSVTADHPIPLQALGKAMANAGRSIDVLLDLDVGQHRTGIAPGESAHALYRQIASTPGLKPGGLHVYDGHQHQPSLADRQAAVDAEWRTVSAFCDRIAEAGLQVPRIVAGGTPTFPIFAAREHPALELSPGTCVFGDAGYSEMFPDMDFPPAALVMTRVMSRPTPDRITVDLGYKGVAADPPAGKRAVFPALPEARQVLHNEEHLVLETPRAADFEPGDELLAIPWHICPTTALYKEAYVVSGGKLIDGWPVTSRDRRLTI